MSGKIKAPIKEEINDDPEFTTDGHKKWRRDQDIEAMDVHHHKKLALVTHERLLMTLLIIGALSMVQIQVPSAAPASTLLPGSSAEEKKMPVQVNEFANFTVEWTSVDSAWGREGDMAHYITTKTEPVIAVRALRDVSSLEFSALAVVHNLRAVADASANSAGAQPMPTSTPVFFVVENAYESAFVHWVTESAVFLHYWAELLENYPNLKLWVRTTKDYKKLTAALYGISPERIVTGQLPQPNMCLFPPLQRENSSRMDFMLFITLVERHFERMRAAADPFKQEEIPILIMPRQSKENYAINDRQVPGYDVLGRWATRIGGKVFNTDEVKSMGEQASVLLASKVIVLDYGSSLFFNGVIARDSTILIIGNMMHHVCPRECCDCALGHAYLFLKIISNGNRVHFIPPGDVSAIRNIVPSLPA